MSEWMCFLAPICDFSLTIKNVVKHFLSFGLLLNSCCLEPDHLLPMIDLINQDVKWAIMEKVMWYYYKHTPLDT